MIRTICHRDGRRTCRPSADLDWSTSMTLRRVVRDAMLEGDEVLIDLSQVSFIDATGLSAIVDCLRRARSTGGTVRIGNARPQVLRRIGLVTIRPLNIAGLEASGPDAA